MKYTFNKATSCKYANPPTSFKSDILFQSMKIYKFLHLNIYSVALFTCCYGVLCMLGMLAEVPPHLPVGPQPAFPTYNAITAHINCCKYITHYEKPTILYCHLYTAPMYILNSRDWIQFGTVQFPHKDTKYVIKIDAIAPTLPHTPNFHHQCLKCFLSVLNFNCFTTHFYDWRTSTVLKKWCTFAFNFTRHTLCCKVLTIFKVVHLCYKLLSCNKQPIKRW